MHTKKKNTTFLFENFNGRDYLVELGLDGRPEHACVGMFKNILDRKQCLRRRDNAGKTTSLAYPIQA
jgi:hypothetical protein